ncbi:MAG: type 4a pilus biogenesis protein PilO [Acetobacteraceae bacterium]|nr:type 4a pilus biogenesis protein PilO [Acetobacteraceae bacterium]
MALAAPRLTRREKVLLVVAGALFLGSALYFGGYAPYRSRAASLMQRVREEEDRLSQARATAAQEEQLDAQLKEVAQGLAWAESQIPGRADDIGLLVYIQVSARESGLVLGSLGLPSAEAEGAYLRHPVELEAGGPYPGHLRFLHLLESMPRLVRVERVWLGRSSAPAAQGGGEVPVRSAAEQAAAPPGCVLGRYTICVFTDPELKGGRAGLPAAPTGVGRTNPFLP